MDPAVKFDLMTTIRAVQESGGPPVGRPLVDTMNGSAYSNMKELRIATATEVWRFAFAYDPSRNAVVLCGGGKQGVEQDLFYKELIALADKRYTKWLNDMKAAIAAQQALAAPKSPKTEKSKRSDRTKKGARK